MSRWLAAYGAVLLLQTVLLSSDDLRPVPVPLAGEGPPGYRLDLTSFAPTRAYAVGMQTITLVGTVRNIGSAALPAETVTLRMYAVNGLDYLEGATIIRLPAMDAGASATYRWKVQPTASDAPLVAALVLERPEHMPQIRVLPIQHFAEAPRTFGTPAPPKPVPAARANGSSGWMDNGSIRFRTGITLSDTAAGFLWRKTAGGWRQVGVALPLAEVLSGERAQDPWWEVLKAKRCTAVSDPKVAVLTVSGQVGVRWLASAAFTVRTGSSVIDAQLSLTPRRTMLLHGIRTARLHLGDGSFGSSASETLDLEPVGQGFTRAVRWGEITAGMIWPAQPLFNGWSQVIQPTPDGAEYRTIGAEFVGRGAPVELQAGSTVRVRWRIFAMAPSKSVRDALRVSPSSR